MSEAFVIFCAVWISLCVGALAYMSMKAQFIMVDSAIKGLQMLLAADLKYKEARRG